MQSPDVPAVRAHLIAAIALSGILVSFGAPPTVAATATDLLPDAQMTPIFNVYLQTNRRGYLRLRFGTLVNNIGDGPLIVRGSHRDGEKLTRSFPSSLPVLRTSCRTPSDFSCSGFPTTSPEC